MTTNTKLTKAELLSVLTEKGFLVDDASNFYGKETNGIWFKDGETKEASADLYTELSWDVGFDDRFPITELLEKFGWYAEPYDGGTLMAYPAL